MVLAIYPTIAQDTIDFPPRNRGEVYTLEFISGVNPRYSKFNYNPLAELNQCIFNSANRLIV